MVWVSGGGGLVAACLFYAVRVLHRKDLHRKEPSGVNGNNSEVEIPEKSKAYKKRRAFRVGPRHVAQPRTDDTCFGEPQKDGSGW